MDEGSHHLLSLCNMFSSLFSFFPLRVCLCVDVGKKGCLAGPVDLLNECISGATLISLSLSKIAVVACDLDKMFFLFSLQLGVINFKWYFIDSVSPPLSLVLSSFYHLLYLFILTLELKLIWRTLTSLSFLRAVIYFYEI